MEQYIGMKRDHPRKLLQIAARGIEIVSKCIDNETPNEAYPYFKYYYFEYGYQGFEAVVPNLMEIPEQDVNLIRQ